MAYNGWKNWETWNTHRWLTIDEEARHLAHTAAQQEGGEGLRDAARAMMSPAIESSEMATEYINHSLEQVDWDEVAQAIMNQMELS